MTDILLAIAVSLMRPCSHLTSFFRSSRPPSPSPFTSSRLTLLTLTATKIRHPYHSCACALSLAIECSPYFTASRLPVETQYLTKWSSNKPITHITVMFMQNTSRYTVVNSPSNRNFKWKDLVHTAVLDSFVFYIRMRNAPRLRKIWEFVFQACLPNNI